MRGQCRNTSGGRSDAHPRPGRPDGTPIDKDALRRRYLEERDKRLRPDGNDQYLRLTGRLAHDAEDPYTPRVERDPRTDHVTVAFIGGGFAGLVTCARLKEAGVADVRIVEKGQDDGPKAKLNVGYPAGAAASFAYLTAWRESGDFDGLAIR